MVLHPRYLFGAIDDALYIKYRKLNRARALSSYKAMSEMMVHNNLVKIKDHPPYPMELEVPVLLNSAARASLDKTGSYSFSKLPSSVPVDTTNAQLAAEALKNANTVGVGVDQGKNLFAHFTLMTHTTVQNSSPPFLRGTLLLSRRTTRMQRRYTVNLNPIRPPPLPLAGLERRQSSNHLESLERALVLH